MDIVSTKVLVAVLFGLVRFLAGVFPIQIYKWLKLLDDPGTLSKSINRPKREQLVGCFLALFQSFGGGVLFATCLLHMMPEVYRCVEELKRFGLLNTDYPYSQLIVSSGFFLVYFVEEVSQYLISITPQEGCKKSNKRAITPMNDAVNAFSEKPAHPNGYIQEVTFNESSPKKVPYFIEVAVENAQNLKNTLDDNQNLQGSPGGGDGELQNLDKQEVNETDELGKLLDSEVKTQQQILRCFLIVVALSLHAVFEGLAIGLQHSVGNIWYLFVAVSVHSATILFCMGMELLKAGTRIKTIFIHIFILSITSPIGIFTGLAISLTSETDTEAKSLAVVVLEGLSAGTILYITFFEVLNREKEMRIYRLRRAICIIGGFTLMAWLESAKLYD